MSISDIYGTSGGNFLKAKDLPEKEIFFFWIKSAVAVTKTFRPEEGAKSMIELRFFETADNPHSKKTWTLNRTQAEYIEGIYGALPMEITTDFNGNPVPRVTQDTWAFKGLRLYRGKTTFQGEVRPTIMIAPDPFQMDDAQRANAQAVLQAEAQSNGAPTHTGMPVADLTPPQLSGFTPPSSFVPPATGSDPTEGW